MRSFFLSILFFAGAVFCTQAQDLSYDPKEYIEWNEHYKLSWDVFLGEADPDLFGDAGTAVKIQAKPYLIGRDVYYEVYALFNKTSSWYKEKSPELLAHEQLHFDIAELTARQVRQEVERLRKSGEKDPGAYNDAIEKILHKSNAYDARYDKETLHGLLEDKQHEWQLLVKNELIRLDRYKKSKALIGKSGAK